MKKSHLNVHYIDDTDLNQFLNSLGSKLVVNGKRAISKAMIQRHKNDFLATADQFSCWIILREPNELSDKWIGRAGYKPKRVTCKAKSADNPNHPLGGLVVNPILCPEAFTSQSLTKARITWGKDFFKNGQYPPSYSCIEGGPLKGVVERSGAFIHADYDLMTICKANEKGEFLFTTKKELYKLFRAIKPVLSRRLGVGMIRHGTEFQFMNDVGAKEFEKVIMFGPGRRIQWSVSSMPKGEYSH